MSLLGICKHQARICKKILIYPTIQKAEKHHKPHQKIEDQYQNIPISNPQIKAQTLLHIYNNTTQYCNRDQ